MTSPHSASSAEPAALRRDVRERAIAAREALPLSQREALTARIENHLDALVAQLAPRALGFCWPYRGEPDLRAWTARWLAAGSGRQAALPVVLERATPLVFRRWTADAAMALDRHGIPYPAAGEMVVPDLVLIPLNAFDNAGFRLGYGGGYFDRTLAELRATSAAAPVAATLGAAAGGAVGPLVIGVGHELALLETIYPQPHDMPLDYVVTERGVYRRDPDGGGTLRFLEHQGYSSPACYAGEIAPGYLGEV